MKERQKRFLLVLPVLVFPFLTFLLWSVGLFSPNRAKAQNNAIAEHGFNMHLPDAKLKDNKSWNKLDFYQQADADSEKMKEAMQNDPFFKRSLSSLRSDTGNALMAYHDPNVDKVNQQLATLKAVLNQPPAVQAVKKDTAFTIRQAAIGNDETNRLQNMVQAIHQQDTTADPEMKQLNSMMDKILDIQHPERVKERIQQTSLQHRQDVFPVTANNDTERVSVLQPDDTAVVKQNAFYSLDDNMLLGEQQNTIQAVVPETQTLTSGSTVKLQLVNDVYINGVLIPQGQYVYGTASLSGERLNINISSIRYQNNILPVALSVFDLDGLGGVFIPGAISRDVAKQSADESLQGIGVTTLDPSLGAQAASAGIQAAKTLIGKKVRLIRVTVKAGYQVLLKDNNNKQ